MVEQPADQVSTTAPAVGNQVPRRRPAALILNFILDAVPLSSEQGTILVVGLSGTSSLHQRLVVS